MQCYIYKYLAALKNSAYLDTEQTESRKPPAKTRIDLPSVGVNIEWTCKHTHTHTLPCAFTYPRAPT